MKYECSDKSRQDEIKAMLREQLQAASNLLQGYKVFLFGSRAAGTARSRSDFDIGGVYGEQPIELAAFYAIEDLFDDLPTLYTIDWVDLNRAGPEFRRRAMERIETLYE